MFFCFSFFSPKRFGQHCTVFGCHFSAKLLRPWFAANSVTLTPSKTRLSEPRDDFEGILGLGGILFLGQAKEYPHPLIDGKGGAHPFSSEGLLFHGFPPGNGRVEQATLHQSVAKSKKQFPETSVDGPTPAPLVCPNQNLRWVLLIPSQLEIVYPQHSSPILFSHRSGQMELEGTPTSAAMGHGTHPHFWPQGVRKKTGKRCS